MQTGQTNRALSLSFCPCIYNNIGLEAKPVENHCPARVNYIWCTYSLVCMRMLCRYVYQTTCLTCYIESSCTANDRAQVVYSGHTLVNTLVGFIVFRVHHWADEQRTVGQDLPAIIWGQAEERAIFLPFDLGRRLTVDWAVEQRWRSPHCQCIRRLRGEPEWAEVPHCWSYGGRG